MGRRELTGGVVGVICLEVNIALLIIPERIMNKPFGKLDRGLLWSAIAAVVICGLIVLWRPSSMARQSSVADAISLGNLRIGEALRHVIRVRVPGDMTPDSVSKVTSSCGCARLDLWRPCDLGDGRGVELAIVTEPGPFDTQVSSQLTIAGANGEVKSVGLHGTIEAPFEGWPAAVVGSFESGAFAVTIPEAYREKGLRLRVFDGQGRELVSEGTGGRFVVRGVDRTKVAEYEAVVEFPRERACEATDEEVGDPTAEGLLPLRWAGVLALREGEAPVH
jgi:hypothetical protein